MSRELFSEFDFTALLCILQLALLVLLILRKKFNMCNILIFNMNHFTGKESPAY